MRPKRWIYIDESGTEPKALTAQGDYFALTAVAVEDEEALNSRLQAAVSELRSQRKPIEGARRVVKRGYFHASKDTGAVRCFFLQFLSGLRFECMVAIAHSTSPPAPPPYDSLVVQLFEEMLPPGPPSREMEIVVALRGAQSASTGKGREYQSRIASVREYLRRKWPSLALSLPALCTVRHANVLEEPGLQLPDYCGWAVRRDVRDEDASWFELLRPTDPEPYVIAGNTVGMHFYCN